jgi:hypothetical protein
MTSVSPSTTDSALRCSIISYRFAYRYRWSKSSRTPNWYACFRYGSGSIRATHAVRSTATCSYAIVVSSTEETPGSSQFTTFCCCASM